MDCRYLSIVRNRESAISDELDHPVEPAGPVPCAACRRGPYAASLAACSLAASLASLELLSATGLIDFREVLPSGGPAPWNHPDNARDPELIHIHKPYLKRAGATRGDIALSLHLAGTTALSLRRGL